MNNGNHYEILPFSNDMITLINSSGIVITRSGSTTISEILALKSIPIFVPSPNVTDNHQYFNALNIVNSGVGILIEEKDLTIDNVIKRLNEINLNYNQYICRLNEYRSINNISLIIDELIKLGDING